MDRTQLNIHKKLSLWAGFCYPMPEFESRSKCFRTAWKIYLYLPFAFMVVELMSQAVQITISIHNVEILTTCTLSTVYIVQFLLKVVIFKRNEKIFKKIFSEMSGISSSLMENPFGDDHFPKFFEKYYKGVMAVGLSKGSLQLACNLGLNILFCVLSWVGMKPKITAAFSWTPYDSSKNPGYTLTCLFEMICYGAVTARTAVLDLLFWIMIIVPTTQFNYLKYLMGVMLKDVEEEGTPNNEDGETKNDEVVSLQLQWWMKLHQRILGMVQDFESLASPFLAVNYIASLIDLFMSGFVAISSSQWDIFQRILINAIIVTDVFQLYVISLAGDWLRESSLEVADFGFTRLIFILKRDVRRNYLYILSRTRRLIQIRFGGINPLSSHTFSRLIQLTMTYFVTVIQIRGSLDEKSSQSGIPFLN